MAREKSKTLGHTGVGKTKFKTIGEIESAERAEHNRKRRAANLVIRQTKTLTAVLAERLDTHPELREEVIDKQLALMRSENEFVAQTAIKAIWDRSDGPVEKKLALTVESLKTKSDEELLAIITDPESGG